MPALVSVTTGSNNVATYLFIRVVHKTRVITTNYILQGLWELCSRESQMYDNDSSRTSMGFTASNHIT